MVKLSGFSLASNSYWRATWMAYLENATSPRVPCLGLTPPIPPMRKYVEVRSKAGERVRAVMVEAALISDSPVVSWQTEPSARQWACGKRGEKPGTVMFFARRFPMEPAVYEFSYQISASGENYRFVRRYT